jgi:fructan beta-fructosidase
MKKLLMIKSIKTVILAMFCCNTVFAGEISLKITKRYLNLPVSQQVERKRMTFNVNGKTDRTFVIRLSANPEYWVFADMSAYKGKTLSISFEGDPAGLEKIYQDDRITGADSLYREFNRPQVHFTPRRGWNNDPNGLLYYDGEYHLFYQHNPYEREWENMHWGHAVSPDLIHWEELPEALYPDEHGTMWSGSAVIDYENTSGFGASPTKGNKGNLSPMVAVYTAGAAKQVQCVAYSLDKGRTWTKYSGNPVIDSKDKWNSNDTRDPKVFWYKPNKEWVLVLNERDGNSIYTSPNLKEWKYESHVTGFWECPELFELAVDGNRNNTKWVMYGASGTYMIGSFDGRKFTPESGKHYYVTGAIYAAQTYTNIPESDGRRIQTGWGRIQQPGMPFNQMMLLPTELTLRTTKNGLRLFSNPVREVESIQTLALKSQSLTSQNANETLRPFSDKTALRIRTTIKLSHATDAGLNLYGQELLKYDMNFNLVNGIFYSPEDMTSMEISADIIIDKTSVEVFIDGGAYSYSMERRPRPENREGFHFWGHNIEIKYLEVYEMQSIWKDE